MESSKVKIWALGDGIALAAAMGFGGLCFLGRYLYTLGDITQSVLWASVTAVLLFVFADGAARLKRTNRNFTICLIFEVIFVFLFVGVVLYSVFFDFSHYFVVMGQKAEIQHKLVKNITQAEAMFVEYEKYTEKRKESYKRYLKSVADPDAKAMRPSEYAGVFDTSSGIGDEKQIEEEIFIINAELYPSDYNTMKQEATSWLAKARNNVETWNAMGIVDVVNEVEKSKEWLSALVELSAKAKRQKNEQVNNFVYGFTIDDVKERFETHGKPTLWSIGLAVILVTLMLLYYIVSPRSARL